MGYAYILTHPGTPCVFYTDWTISSIRSAVINLMAARTKAALTSVSSVYIEKATSSLYAAYIDGRLAVKLGTASWSPSDTTYKLYTSGNNYAVWIK
jgi:alpha-amylase